VVPVVLALVAALRICEAGVLLAELIAGVTLAGAVTLSGMVAVFIFGIH
jgi:hypothetical protein